MIRIALVLLVAVPVAAGCGGGQRGPAAPTGTTASSPPAPATQVTVPAHVPSAARAGLFIARLNQACQAARAGRTPPALPASRVTLARFVRSALPQAGALAAILRRAQPPTRALRTTIVPLVASYSRLLGVYGAAANGRAPNAGQRRALAAADAEVTRAALAAALPGCVAPAR